MAERFFSKGQVTMIFILGLVVLLAFLFLLFARKQISKDVFDEGKVIYELESGIVKDHITACILKVASDAVEKVGESGGVIYDFDGGTIPYSGLRQGKDYLNFRLGERTLKVRYGLRENSYCSQIDYATPNYPVLGKPLSLLPGVYSSDASCIYTHPASDFDGFFGEVSLQKLCPFSRESGCSNFAKGRQAGLAVQSQIEDYVINKLGLCVNLSYFSDRFNALIEFESVASPLVSVRDEDVQVSVKYPVRITFAGSEPISKVFEYHAVVPARLGLIYNFVYSALSRDVREIKFDLAGQALANPYFRSGFEYRKIVNPCLQCEYPFKFDDVFEVVDAKSVVNSKLFVFRVAVQDRRPVLDVIADKVFDLRGASEVKVPISAFDPDDEALNFFFLSEGYGDGWREGDDMLSIGDDGIVLKFTPSYADIGRHKVAVLVVDESGFFDYQWFEINVIDKSFVNSYSDGCVLECESDAMWLSLGQCIEWCTIAANACLSECFNDYGKTIPGCQECVLPIFYAESDEEHVDCSILAGRDVCRVHFKDCFWVVEKSLDYSFESESCYNDRDLGSVQRFASIS